MLISKQVYHFLTDAKRREFSGMIHFITSNVIIHNHPIPPFSSMPYVKRTSKFLIRGLQVEKCIENPKETQRHGAYSMSSMSRMKDRKSLGIEVH